MKKIKSLWGALTVLVAILCLCTMVFAGTVYDRSFKTLTAGAGTWTNTVPYSALQLTRIFVYGSTAATNSIVITRITSGTVSTQAVGTVTLAANIGNTTSFTAGYLKPGDKLKFTPVLGSNATAIIEYQVQQH